MRKKVSHADEDRGTDVLTLADGELLMMAVRTPMACTVMQSEPFSHTYTNTHKQHITNPSYTRRT